VHAVDKPEHRLGIEDVFTFHLQHNKKHAVGTGMLGAHIQKETVMFLKF
jgi:hypothetical protein